MGGQALQHPLEILHTRFDHWAVDCWSGGQIKYILWQIPVVSPHNGRNRQNRNATRQTSLHTDDHWLLQDKKHQDELDHRSKDRNLFWDVIVFPAWAMACHVVLVFKEQRRCRGFGLQPAGEALSSMRLSRQTPRSIKSFMCSGGLQV